jgi:hypothetical protein
MKIDFQGGSALMRSSTTAPTEHTSDVDAIVGKPFLDEVVSFVLHECPSQEFEEDTPLGIERAA